VPVEQVGQQRPRLPLARLRGDAGQQRRPDPGGLGVLGGTRVLGEDRPRQLLAQPFGQLDPPFLQPVPQRQRGPAVVLVVPGHNPLPLAVPGRSPVLERRLQRDQAGGRFGQVHPPAVPAQRLQPLDRVVLHPGPYALPHDPVQVGEHPEPEQVVHLVLTRGKTSHQRAHRLLPRPVELGEMVDRRRLVMVVVVDVQTGMTGAALGDEVDQLLERALLTRPVEGPDLRVPGESRLVTISRVDHAEQVLQPELPPVLGVVPGPLDIEEQVAVGRFRQRQQPPVGDQGTGAVLFGIQDLVLDASVVLAGHLQPGLPLGALEGVRAHPVQPRQLGQPGEPAPGRDPGALQRPPLPRRHPGHQRQVIVGSPAVAAHIAPPADSTVLDRLRVDLSRRVFPDGGLQQPPRLPLIGGKVAHLERDELPVAQGQVHPPRLYLLHVGQQVRVKRGLQHGAGLRGPGQLGVDDLIVGPGRPLPRPTHLAA
jgi:hypothetical protein